MAHKAFHTATSSEAVAFDLEDTTFHCRPRMPAGVILGFAAAMEGDDEKAGAAAIGAITALFKAAIVTDEYDEFDRMINDPDLGIDIMLLTDVASWLAEQYTARPTGGPSGSTSPGTNTGSGSTGGVSREVSTYSRSATPAGATR